jgi:hypothetical protein
LIVVNDDADLIERGIEAIVARFFMMESFEGSVSFDDDDGDAERYDRVVVVDDAGEEMFSFK